MALAYGGVPAAHPVAPRDAIRQHASYTVPKAAVHGAGEPGAHVGVVFNGGYTAQIHRVQQFITPAHRPSGVGHALDQEHVPAGNTNHGSTDATAAVQHLQELPVIVVQPHPRVQVGGTRVDLVRRVGGTDVEGPGIVQKSTVAERGHAGVRHCS